MTRRYREPLDAVELAVVPDRHGEPTPAAFSWRGRRYRIEQVLGHWREDQGWWRRPDGEPVRIEQADLWRVEAADGVEPRTRVDVDAGGVDGEHARRHRAAGGPTSGVYELARRGDEWRLHRVWD